MFALFCVACWRVLQVFLRAYVVFCVTLLAFRLLFALLVCMFALGLVLLCCDALSLRKQA